MENRPIDLERDVAELVDGNGDVSITNVGGKKRRTFGRAVSKIFETDLIADGDPQTIAQIHSMMERFDANKDGTLGVDEILQMHNALKRESKQTNNLRELIVVLFIVLCLSVTANFGTSIVANKVTSDTVLRSNILTSSSDQNAIVVTSTAKTNLPLYLLPVAGPDILDNIHHVQFTALNVTIKILSMSQKYATVPIGMDIESYQYFSETSVLLQGVGTERLFIDDGQVFGWGFEGILTEPFDVCPGKQDASHAACYLVLTNDVDVNALIARAQALGISTS